MPFRCIHALDSACVLYCRLHVSNYSTNLQMSTLMALLSSSKHTTIIAQIHEQYERFSECVTFHFSLKYITSLTLACTYHRSKLLTLLICISLPGGQVSYSSLCAFRFLFIYLCYIFLHRLFNLHMWTWGKRPNHSVGINELLCCAQPVQDLI